MKKKKTTIKPGLQNYELATNTGAKVKLSSLFGKQNYLIILHNMGKNCPTCIVYADEFNGALDDIEKKASFCVVGPDDWQTQKKYVAEHSWKFSILSSHKTTFEQDLGFAGQEGVSIFTKKPGGVILIETQLHALPGRAPSVVDVISTLDSIKK